jgi:hypothetical protein
MRIAIVGPSEKKWKTKEQIVKAKKEIEYLLTLHHSKRVPSDLGFWYSYKDIVLVSGHCPKGGIDIWAETFADENLVTKKIFSAEVNQWEDKVVFLNPSGFQTIKDKRKGYKSRNIQIAEACDVLYCLVPLDKEEYCVHCNKENHPTNGGCWTLRHAAKLGKETHLVVID